MSVAGADGLVARHRLADLELLDEVESFELVEDAVDAGAADGASLARSASSISIAESAQVCESSSSSSAWRAAPVWCLFWASTRCARLGPAVCVLCAIGLSLILSPADHGMRAPA